MRATGDVLRDQFRFLVRAGFDSFEVKKPADAAAFAKSVERYSVAYQPTGDGRVPALRAARRRRDASSRLGRRRGAKVSVFPACARMRTCEADIMNPVVAVIAPGAMGAAVGKKAGR